MSEISIKLTIPAIRRAQTRYQIPGVVRAQGPDRTILGGFSWALSAQDVPAVAGGQSWTIPALSRARYWQGTDSQVTLDPAHGYMVFAVPGDPQLWFIENENWAAVPAGQDVCKVASVDPVFDLRPRLPQRPTLPFVVWVINNGNRSVTVFAPDGTALGSFTNSLLTNPQGIALVNNEVWIANFSNGTIYRFDFNGNLLGTITTDLTTPVQISVIDDQAWITNTDGTIARLKFDGDEADLPLSGNGMSGPIGIARAGSEVWVADEFTFEISRWTPAGISAGSTYSGNGLHNPFGIVVPGTQAWFLNEGNDTISRFNFDGSSAGAVLSGNSLSQPFGGAVVPLSGTPQAWIANRGNNMVSRFKFDGTVADTSLTDASLNQPVGVAVVPTGFAPIWS